MGRDAGGNAGGSGGRRCDVRTRRLLEPVVANPSCPPVWAHRLRWRCAGVGEGRMPPVGVRETVAFSRRCFGRLLFLRVSGAVVWLQQPTGHVPKGHGAQTAKTRLSSSLPLASLPLRLATPLWSTRSVDSCWPVTHTGHVARLGSERWAQGGQHCGQGRVSAQWPEDRPRVIPRVKPHRVEHSSGSLPRVTHKSVDGSCERRFGQTKRNSDGARV